MLRSNIRYVLCLTTKLLFAIAFCNAQQNSSKVSFERPISYGDSMLLMRYIDSANSAGLFSIRYQNYMDSAVAIKPWKANWWQHKAMPLYKKKKYELGAPYLDSAVKYDEHSFIDYRAFMKCIFQKSYRSAIADFNRSKVVIGDGDVMDHTYDFYIGLCYLQLNKLDSAAWYLNSTTAEQLKTTGEGYVHPLDLFYLGIVYYEMNDYVRANEAFERSLKLYKNFSDAEYYNALCLKKLDKNEAALALMTKARDDFKAGYTINEDNVDYEVYPYQITKLRAYDGSVQWLRGK